MRCRLLAGAVGVDGELRAERFENRGHMDARNSAHTIPPRSPDRAGNILTLPQRSIGARFPRVLASGKSVAVSRRSLCKSSIVVGGHKKPPPGLLRTEVFLLSD